MSAPAKKQLPASGNLGKGVSLGEYLEQALTGHHQPAADEEDWRVAPNSAADDARLGIARLALDRLILRIHEYAAEWARSDGRLPGRVEDTFPFSDVLPFPTQVIVSLDEAGFTFKIERVTKTGADAPPKDDLFERIADLHDSGVLSLVPTEAKDRIKEEIEIEVARAKDASWHPAQTFDPESDDPWEFYIAVYKGKEKPSAGRLYECDRPLYKRLTARASRNKSAGLPRSEDNPHSIHDIFPERTTSRGRVVRALKPT